MFYLVFWRNRSTATVVTAPSAARARALASARHKKGYGPIVSVRQANREDSRLIRKGTWVRRRRNGTSPQFGSAASKAAARRIRSRYRPGLIGRVRSAAS
jgi:hypothetical protein